MKKFVLVAALLIAVTAIGQSRFANKPGGQLTLGIRSATSLFSDESGVGTGFGGQFRLRFFHLLNSEWFADYITSDLHNGLGNRTDYHIGWSVMFYPSFAYHQNERLKLQPYFLAGHCFDYTRCESNVLFEPNVASRWSSAVQAGLGCHLPLHDRLDLSFSGQYMMHLGTEINAVVRKNAGGLEYLYFDESQESGLEGHLLLTVSLNVRVADLWKNTIKGVQDKKPMEEQQ
jgi:hypothetical protein